MDHGLVYKDDIEYIAKVTGVSFDEAWSAWEYYSSLYCAGWLDGARTMNTETLKKIVSDYEWVAPYDEMV